MNFVRRTVRVTLVETRAPYVSEDGYRPQAKPNLLQAEFEIRAAEAPHLEGLEEKKSLVDGDTRHKLIFPAARTRVRRHPFPNSQLSLQVS